VAGCEASADGCIGCAAVSVDGSVETVAGVEGMLAVTVTDGTLTVAGPDLGTVTVAFVSGTDTVVGTDGTSTLTAGAVVSSDDTGVTSTDVGADETTVVNDGIST
jgi:hypothetical protein